MSRPHILIAGGGVAGCATAIALAGHGFRTTILQHAPDSRAPFGETLAPTIRHPLTQLNLWHRFVEDGHHPSHGTYSAWGSPALYSNDFLFHPHGSGWHIDRPRFDRMLLQAAQDCGTAIVHRRLTHLRKTGPGWHVTLDDATTLDIGIVVDATGRASAIARRLGARRVAFDNLIASARFYHLPDGPADSFTLIESTPHGWWYSALLPRSRMVVASFTHPTQREAIAAGPHTRARLDRARPASPPVTCAANSSCLHAAAGPGWLAVGDASSTWDPLSSQGIAQALRSALSAADAVAASCAGNPGAIPGYAESERAHFTRYLQVRSHYYCRETRWSGSPFWAQSRQLIPAQRTQGLCG